MNTTTANVETLTAEVRVLMVGNRQITQSVAKQLDRVHPSAITPFGRIRLGRDTLIIGRHATDLVLANPYTPPRSIFSPKFGGIRITLPSDWWGADLHGLIHLKTSAGCSFQVHRDDVTYEQLASEHRPQDADWVLTDHRDQPWFDAFEKRLLADIEFRETEAWKDLPLIVLAGLR